MLVGVLVSLALPTVLQRVLRAFHPKRHAALQLFGVLALSTLFAYACGSVGSSELLGCFLAGMAFSGFKVR